MLIFMCAGGHSVGGQPGQSADCTRAGSRFHLRTPASAVSAGTRATHGAGSPRRGTSCWSRGRQRRRRHEQRRHRRPFGSGVPHRSAVFSGFPLSDPETRDISVSRITATTFCIGFFCHHFNVSFGFGFKNVIKLDVWLRFVNHLLNYYLLTYLLTYLDVCTRWLA